MRAATRLLVISRSAGSMDEALEQKLRKAFSDHTIVDFDPKGDLSQMASPRARIVVAGGDGTVEFIVRQLANSRHPIGIIPLGTYNNLAHALGLTGDIDNAIEVARHGTPRPITLGRVNDHLFVEGCAIGLFGETIALGDAAKGHELGDVTEGLKKVITARPFHYELSGDLDGNGTAMSLVFSNTSSIGIQLPVANTSPRQRYLEFSVHAGISRTDIARQAIVAALTTKHTEDGAAQVLKFRHLEVKTRPRVRVYADNFLAGRTPAVVTAETSALKVLLPA